MVDVDIGLSEIFKDAPGTFEICAIHGDECIVLTPGFLFDPFAYFKIFERSRSAGCQHHLHGFARVAQSKPQIKQGADGISVWSNVRGYDDPARCIQSIFYLP